MDGEEKTDLKPDKGTNELMFILTSDAYRQNWGIIARISGLAVLSPALFNDMVTPRSNIHQHSAFDSGW